MLVERDGARFDAAARLAMKIDEAAAALGRSQRDDEEALRLLALMAVVRERKSWRHSSHPCSRCGAVEVRVQTDDDSDDSTVWCYACDRTYREDGADS